MNVYFTVNPVKKRIGKKPTKGDIAGAEYAHVDIDPDVQHGLRRGTAPPAGGDASDTEGIRSRARAIIDSGNGLGVFWRLDGASIEEVEAINQRLIAQFGGDAGTWNVDRLMRLPGTLNYPSKKKLDKGYPAEPGVAQLLVANPGGCSVEQLDAALPTVVKTALEPKATPAVCEEATPLSEDEIEALRSKLDEALDLSPSLSRRWHGETDGFTDTSRSGLDFSVTALLKALGFSYRETAHLLVHEFKHGKGRDNTERDLERNWDRCGASSPEEIAALCIEAKTARRTVGARPVCGAAQCPDGRCRLGTARQGARFCWQAGFEGGL